ncbi:MAG TPA: YceD family protein [Saprospiraceae bacterium]|nr:YceD family protein [Saprospiraceae bacterium]HPI05498.1 YceD family protein [Saprospiraceae bacterium]
MNALAPYSIPIQGLKVGMHHYQFEVDDEFFSLFEDSPLQDGKMKFEIDFDKRADMLLIDFRLEGSVRAECDRCTAMIDLPLQDERQLIVKYGEDEGEEEDEVVFISREASDFNLAQYLYEFSVLALPIRNAYDCQNTPTPPCNFEVLDFLEKEEKESEARKSGTIWDALKDLNKDN